MEPRQRYKTRSKRKTKEANMPDELRTWQMRSRKMSHVAQWQICPGVWNMEYLRSTQYYYYINLRC